VNPYCRNCSKPVTRGAMKFLPVLILNYKGERFQGEREVFYGSLVIPVVKNILINYA